MGASVQVEIPFVWFPCVLMRTYEWGENVVLVEGYIIDFTVYIASGILGGVYKLITRGTASVERRGINHH